MICQLMMQLYWYDESIIVGWGMEQVMPLEMATHSFKAKIHNLKPIVTRNTTTHYQASTSLGHMTLTVQCVVPPHPCPEEEFIKRRNQMIREGKLSVPLVYEQEIIKIRENYFVCMTLTEPVEMTVIEEIQQNGQCSVLEGLIECASKAGIVSLGYGKESLDFMSLIRSKHTERLYMDFTTLRPTKVKNDELETFATGCSTVISKIQTGKAYEALFIKQLPISYNSSAISKVRSWLELALLCNLMIDGRPTPVSPNAKTDPHKNKNSGRVTLEWFDEVFPEVRVWQGFIMEGVTETDYTQLASTFFQKGQRYDLTKDKYMRVIRQSHKEEEIKEYQADGLRAKKDCIDVIRVHQGVTKAELIHFIILYLKYLSATLISIHYRSTSNQLQLNLHSKQQPTTTVLFQFHRSYVVKDQQLSMIIEKTKMKKASINLASSQCSDGLLIFLANCQKTSQVAQIDVSWCNHISESGLSIFYSSPFIKYLKKLTVRGQSIPDPFLLRHSKLETLNISNCSFMDNQEEANLTQLPITRLEALQISFPLKLTRSLRFLYLDQALTGEGLKGLKGLALEQLRIRIVESKKAITSYITNLYSKGQNPFKAFSDGTCRQTLRLLDLSHSTIKLKQMRSIFAIASLQTLILEQMQGDRFDDLVLPSHITSVSVKRSGVNAQTVQSMLLHSSIMITMNLAYSNVRQQKLALCLSKKKYVSVLEVDESQVDSEYLAGCEFIQSIAVHLDRLTRDHNQAILNDILIRQSQKCRQIELICHQSKSASLEQKLHRFYSYYGTTFKAITKINGSTVSKVLNRDCSQQKGSITVNGADWYREYAITDLTQQAQVDLNIFGVALLKTLRAHPACLIDIDFHSNRLIGKEAITLLKSYAVNFLRSIDFRNCVFSYCEVEKQLFAFPALESVNRGEYEISIGPEDDCQLYLQPIFKFFMKLKVSERVKLCLKAQSVSQIILYYSILCELLHHFENCLTQISINFAEMSFVSCKSFWQAVFHMPNLQSFHLFYHNQERPETQDQADFQAEFEGLSSLKLHTLLIDSSMKNLPSSLPSSLKSLSLNIENSGVSQSTVARLIKPLTGLTKLDLNLASCHNITTVGKLSSSIQKMQFLSHLSLNFESCQLKQNSLLEFIDHLRTLPYLECLCLNLINAFHALPDLTRKCEVLSSYVPFCHIQIYVLQPKRSLLQRQRDQLLLKGIDLFLQ